MLQREMQRNLRQEIQLPSPHTAPTCPNAVNERGDVALGGGEPDGLLLLMEVAQPLHHLLLTLEARRQLVHALHQLRHLAPSRQPGDRVADDWVRCARTHEALRGNELLTPRENGPRQIVHLPHAVLHVLRLAVVPQRRLAALRPRLRLGARQLRGRRLPLKVRAHEARVCKLPLLHLELGLHVSQLCLQRLHDLGSISVHFAS